jgi:nitroreductase
MNATIADCIRTRRTVKAFTGEAVPRAQLERWLELACWAPTHRLTQPWRFAVLDQPAIARLGGFLQGEPAIAAVPDPAKGAAKLAKLRERLPTLGALVQVGWKRDADPAIDLEEHAAASAAVQNLLLAAHADGWAAFWSTNPALGHPATLRWCGLDPASEGFVASLWLGRATPPLPPAPPRALLATRVRWL